MTIAAGREVYGIGKAPVSARGVALNEDEFLAAMDGPVATLLKDEQGALDIRQVLDGVTETNFQSERLEQILRDCSESIYWQAGEALGESYLVSHRDCQFPWPVRRDVKKQESSLPGADLVGFRCCPKNNADVCFAFGEVKTSNQSKAPPGVMYGRHGLKQQLEDLRDKEALRNTLFTYLGFRANNASWMDLYRAAAAKYLKDSKDVVLFGVLVRDIDPNEKDLSARQKALAKNCPGGMRIELLSIYIPIGKVKELGNIAKGESLK